MRLDSSEYLKHVKKVLKKYEMEIFDAVYLANVTDEPCLLVLMESRTSLIENDLKDDSYLACEITEEYVQFSKGAIKKYGKETLEEMEQDLLIPIEINTKVNDFGSPDMSEFENW